jgi:hypothetical protein
LDLRSIGGQTLDVDRCVAAGATADVADLYSDAILILDATRVEVREANRGVAGTSSEQEPQEGTKRSSIHGSPYHPHERMIEVKARLGTALHVAGSNDDPTAFSDGSEPVLGL